MQFYRVGWFLKDLARAIRRALFLGIVAFFGFSVGAASALAFIRAEDIHVDCTYAEPGFP